MLIYPGVICLASLMRLVPFPFFAKYSSKTQHSPTFKHRPNASSSCSNHLVVNLIYSTYLSNTPFDQNIPSNHPPHHQNSQQIPLATLPATKPMLSSQLHRVARTSQHPSPTSPRTRPKQALPTPDNPPPTPYRVPSPTQNLVGRPGLPAPQHRSSHLSPSPPTP